MKKVFDQTVRDLKREVNKKVLKVPGIEQKVLDATSNEPWGPHGSLLADIAVATRNYHEYQMIMTVIWKRLNDTGKNWRHVYKALLILEYLVANGSERVIDEIREHAYQIATLSEFQYIDSSGRDQGNNVRRKSQSLVALVNDKEKIIEVRQKAAANREKFRSTPSGGMYRPGAGGYGDRYDDDRYEGRYGSREEDRNGYGKEREWGYKDDDRYGRYSDPYSRDGDRYGREYEDRYGRDSYREDEFRGRSQSVDDGYRHGSRSRSSDRDKERSFDDPYSSRGSGVRADENSQDGRKIERNFSEQNIGAPPSYEEVVSESRSPAYNERDAEASAASAPRAASPPANNQLAPPPPASNHPASSPPPSHHSSQSNNVDSFAASPAKHEVEAVDAFDPRGLVSAIPVTNNAETDLLGSLSHALAVVPTTSATTTYEVESHVNSGSIPSSSNISQPFEDPFGEGPFKAVPSADATQTQPQVLASSDPSMNQIAEPPHGGAQKADIGSNFGFGDTLSGLTYSTSDISTIQSSTNSESLPQELSATHKNSDILADILPPSQPAFSGSGAHPGQPSVNSFGTYEVQPGAIVPVNMAPQTQSGLSGQLGGGNYLPHGGSTVPGTSHMVPQVSSGPPAHVNNGSFIQQGGYRAPQNGNFYSQQGVFNAPNHGNFYADGGSAIPMTPQMGNQSMLGEASQFNGGNFLPRQGSTAGLSPQVTHQAATGPASPYSNNMLGNLASQTGSSTSMAPQQAKDKFEPKSAVWADTLSRGLVNLNISGPKTNPLSDIGIDFDALNRKEKRMEKQPAQTSVTSTVSMGKAMGSGTGLGRAGAGALRPQANTMGTGMAMGGGLGMGAYGGMSQPMGGMGMGMGMGAGMGMNMAMRQGVPMQMPSGYPPSSTMPGYNPMMGPGGYGQQPYGGYR